MKRILIIDDDDLVLQTLNALLKRQSHEVMMADSGESALKIAEQNELDLVICDLRMPGMNGVEVIESIQKMKKVPVFFITGYADDQNIESAGRLGEILYKPYGIEELINMTNKYLN